MVILLASVLGILGSYGVAWFGIRINTISNSRTAFSALKGNPLATLGIPLRSGMSVGLLLVAVELFFMICILMFLPRELVGPCFIGFAIGESLGASVLRICGGIFTKIADIGSDLMKIVFKLPEDDPKNPGVIADCTGDNAGDSVGPTADGFETYGVTGVALIAFLALALAASPTICATLIIWLFVMRALMIVTSLASYFVNEGISKAMFGGKKDFDFEAPLTHLVWITSAVSIAITFVASKLLLGDFADGSGTAQPFAGQPSWLLASVWSDRTSVSCASIRPWGQHSAAFGLPYQRVRRTMPAAISRRLRAARSVRGFWSAVAADLVTWRLSGSEPGWDVPQYVHRRSGSARRDDFVPLSHLRRHLGVAPGEDLEERMKAFLRFAALELLGAAGLLILSVALMARPTRL